MRHAARLAVLLSLTGACHAGSCSGSAAPAASSRGSRARTAGAVAREERRVLPGLIAFVSERSASRDVWLVTPSGAERRLTDGAADEYPLAVAPDRERLVVAAAREAEGRHYEQLQLTPLDGRPPRVLTAPRARARHPSFAPDGRWFVSESDADSFSDLVRTRLDAPQGSPPERLTSTGKAGAFEPEVSPDGRWIAYASGKEGDLEVYLLATDGSGRERRLTHFHAEDLKPRWSPDGRWLVFLSNRERRDRLFLVRPDGTGTRALSGNATHGDEADAAWRPDGQAVAFTARTPDGKRQVWLATLDGRPPRPLTDATAHDETPVWSPDGQALVFSSDRAPDGDVDLWLVNADGTGLTRLTHAKGADWLPSWFLPTDGDATARETR